MGGAAPATGPDAVAAVFAGKARAVRPMLIDGAPGLVWTVRGTPQVAFLFSFSGDRVTGIEMVGDASRLAALTVEPL
jgi:RNA polymerase sigma-70 factor (ECF subfamily)